MAKTNSAQLNLRQQSKVDEALGLVRLFHTIGTTLNNDQALDKRLKAIYERKNRDTQAKIRRFASFEQGGYSTSELEELLLLCKGHQFPLGFQLIERLMSIHKRNKRKLLQMQMVKKHWSKSELNRQINLLRGSRTPNAGRRMEKLPSAASILPELQRLSSQWMRRNKGVREDFPDEVKRWPKPLRVQLNKVTKQHKQIHGEIKKYLQQTRMK